MELSTGFFLSLAAAIGGIGAAVSAALSWWSFRQDRLVKSDQILMSKATQCLERAWNALTVNGQMSEPPADRLNWLTAARLLLEFENTKPRIKDRAYRELCEAEEAHWRLQFSRVLDPLTTNFAYFSGKESQEKIYPKSAIIIHLFAQWPEGKSDRLDDLGRLEVESPEDLGLSKKWAALRHWLERFNS